MELTLTGASLGSDIPQSRPTPLLADSHQGHNHNHSHEQQQHTLGLNHPGPAGLVQVNQHGHNHNKKCCHAQHHNHSHMTLPHANLSDEQVIEMLKDEDRREVTLVTAVKVGNVQAFEKLCKMVLDMEGGEKDLAKHRKDGHTLAHWAAKRESPDFIRYLSTIPNIPLDVPSLDKVGMTPLHWACTTGSIPNVHTLLTHAPSSLHATDKSGCTPLLISAQYGHATLCAYLVKHGAETAALDKNGDNIFHWGAYKGSTEVVGIACFLEERFLTAVDSFGQTGLHLASLRGNVETVGYILEEAESRVPVHQRRRGGESDTVRYLLNLKDKDGKTPLDLAIKKKKLAVEMLLREWVDRLEQRDHPSYWRQFKKNVRQMVSFRNWIMWMGLNVSNSAADATYQQQKMVGPMTLVISILATAIAMYPWKFIPLQREGYLGDFPFLHMFTITNIALSLYSFYKTYKTNPGAITSSSPNNELRDTALQLETDYESALDSYTSAGHTGAHPTLCHSCHIVRPRRSKHCRIQRKCVLLFDHYCPFVGNTIGLYNYKYFFMFLLSTTLAEIGFFVTWLLYLHRYPETDLGAIIVGLFVIFFVLVTGGMLLYHCQLVYKNLTTNEHQNLYRYEYLRDERGHYRNVFDQGCMANFYERFNPKIKNAEQHGLIIRGAEQV